MGSKEEGLSAGRQRDSSGIAVNNGKAVYQSIWGSRQNAGLFPRALWTLKKEITVESSDCFLLSVELIPPQKELLQPEHDFGHERDLVTEYCKQFTIRVKAAGVWRFPSGNT